jgi:hypothetical protein
MADKISESWSDEENEQQSRRMVFSWMKLEKNFVIAALPKLSKWLLWM